MENKYIFGEDYCLCMVAHPNFYKHYCDWEPESNEEVGEYKKYRDRTIRYFWSNYASYDPMVGTMPISDRAINPEPEYFYAPYIPVISKVIVDGKEVDKYEFLKELKENVQND